MALAQGWPLCRTLAVSFFLLGIYEGIFLRQTMPRLAGMWTAHRLWASLGPPGAGSLWPWIPMVLLAAAFTMAGTGDFDGIHS